MKTVIKILVISLLVVFIAAFHSLSASATGNATFSWSVNHPLRSGETVTLTCKVNTSTDIAAFDMIIKYDTTKLTFKSISPIGLASSEFSHSQSDKGIAVVYLDDDGGTTGIKTGNVFQISFEVAKEVPVGTKTSVSMEIDGCADKNISPISVTATPILLEVAHPLSSNNYLSSLSIQGYSFTPSFSKDNLTYNLTILHNVTSLNITATAEDKSASFDVSGNTGLVAGKTKNITIKVTAENGSVRTYTIKVTNQKAPATSSQSSSSTVTSNASQVSSIDASQSESSHYQEVSSTKSVDSSVSKSSISSTVTSSVDQKTVSMNVFIISIIIAIIASGSAGFVIGWSLKSRWI